MADHTKLEGRLGYKFVSFANLRRALHHPSTQDPSAQIHYRLAWIGDAVISVVVADRLFARYPHATEHELSKWRSALTSNAALGQVAKRIHLQESLVLGSGLGKNRGQKPGNEMLATAFEAVIGAVFLDGGINEAARVVKRILAEDFRRLFAEVPQR